MRILVALGGNALLRRGERPDASVQLGHIAAAAAVLAPLTRDHQVVVTHGAGPQIGLLAQQSEHDPTLREPYPLDAVDAQTQGLLGYWLQRELANAGAAGPVVTLVSQTLVAAGDPAFDRPTKFVGPGYPKDEADRLAAQWGWSVAADGDRWRRVVASPEPLEVLEVPVAHQLLDSGAVVLCGGSGGAAVVRADGRLRGADAIVDKDLSAALIARDLGADMFALLTDVPAVLVDYGTPGQRPLRDATPAQLRALGLPEGSMGPKAEAVCRFVEATGKRAAIGALEDAAAIVAGTAGTQVRTGAE
jgi:carbamate kinase